MAFPPRPTLPDPDLVFEFFWRFTTMECAMKHAGFCKARGDSDAIEADWDSFAKDMEQRGAARSQSFLAAARDLQRLRPQRQVVVNGKPGWEPIKAGKSSEVEYSLRLLRLVRNNLFHGGKYEYGEPQNEIARDTDILRAALEVLEQCFEHHPTVQERVLRATA